MDWKFTDDVPSVASGKPAWLFLAFALAAFALACMAAF